jgi:carboxymethylenebutenolidase
MQAKLKTAGEASRIIVYPDAGHGFFADYRPGYSRPDAEASWREATRWLKEHGA